MGSHELSALLWRERELLELLVFKLEVQQLLLTSGRTRWLQRATDEIDQVLGRLREVELARTVDVATVAQSWGAKEDATLRQLVDHAPPGAWGEIFAAHLTAMTELSTQIAELKDVNEQLLRTGLRSTQETLAGPSKAQTYGADGSAEPSGGDAHLVDREL